MKHRMKEKKCTPEIVAIKKTRVIPVAVPVKSMEYHHPHYPHKPAHKPYEEEEEEEHYIEDDGDDDHEHEDEDDGHDEYKRRMSVNGTRRISHQHDDLSSEMQSDNQTSLEQPIVRVISKEMDESDPLSDSSPLVNLLRRRSEMINIEKSSIHLNRKAVEEQTTVLPVPSESSETDGEETDDIDVYHEYIYHEGQEDL